MKHYASVLVVAALAASLRSASAAAPAKASESTLGLGFRTHAAQTTFKDYPFDDGDISYGIAYEFHEEAAYWQLAVDYAFDLGGTNAIDSVVTPQINLVFKDGVWRGGLGALSSYISPSDDTKAEWSDIYYQFLLGIGVPLGKLGLDVMAAYPFSDWGELGDFDAGGIEVVVWLKYFF
jgi:hypothetical protein